MRRLLIIVSIVFLLGCAVAQNTDTVPLTKEQQKAAREQEKAAKKKAKEDAKLAERQRKLQAKQLQQFQEQEKLRPPSLSIYGTPERVKSVLVANYASGGWSIASDTPYQLTFMKDFNERSILGSVLLGNNAPQASRMVVSFLFAQNGNTVMVTGSANKLVQNGWGAISNYIVTPEAKVDLTAELQKAKAVVEANVLAPN